MIYIILLIFIGIFIYCGLVTAKLLTEVGKSELYWFVLFWVFGPFLVAFILASSKYKRVLTINKKKKLAASQLPILLSVCIILLLSLILD